MTETQKDRQQMAVRILREQGYDAFCKFLATNIATHVAKKEKANRG